MNIRTAAKILSITKKHLGFNFDENKVTKTFYPNRNLRKFIEHAYTDLYFEISSGMFAIYDVTLHVTESKNNVTLNLLISFENYDTGAMRNKQISAVMSPCLLRKKSISNLIKLCIREYNKAFEEDKLVDSNDKYNTEVVLISGQLDPPYGIATMSMLDLLRYRDRIMLQRDYYNDYDQYTLEEINAEIAKRG